MARLASVVSKLERSLLLGQAGIGGVVELLEAEGVQFDEGGFVDLARFLWDGG